MDIVPSVATRGLIPRAVTSSPLTSPATPPTNRPTATAAGIDSPSKSSIATTVDDKAITDPTDKSKPPDANNIDIPITMMAIGVMPTDTARKFAMEKKYGDRYDITAMIRRISARSVNSLVSINFRNNLCRRVSEELVSLFISMFIAKLKSG